MATLVLGAAGAAVGFVIGGGPQGAYWGWTIGSAIGAATQKTKLPTIYGPRLNDLTVQSSAYGNMIPMVFGRMRVAGNIIWSTGRIEHTREATQSSGGKGGAKTEQPQVEYYYTASFAVALCEGVILGIRKIWANGQIIYNVDADAPPNTVLGSGLPITVYPGDETQLPDPLIESIMGAGNVPAYRGTAYVVFNDITLEQKWGQGVPNLEFEVIRSGTLIGMRASPIYTLPSSGYLEFL